MINVYDRDGRYHLTITLSEDGEIYHVRLMTATNGKWIGNTLVRFACDAGDSGDTVAQIGRLLYACAAAFPEAARFVQAIPVNASLSSLHDPDHAPDWRFGKI